MKKKIIIVLIVILIVLAIFLSVVFMRNKDFSNNEQIPISKYKYFALYSKNEKVGVIDREGNTVLETKYTDIYIPNPTKDVFICFEGDKSYVVNSKGEKLFGEWQEVSALVTSDSVFLNLENNVLRYRSNDLYGLLDLDGNALTEPIYDEIQSLKNRPGRILVKKDDKYGVLDASGNIVVPISFYSIIGDEYYTEEDGYSSTGYIVSTKTKTGIMYGYYNSVGKKLLDLKYEKIERVLEYNKDDIYLIATFNGKNGIFKNGKKLIDFNHQEIMYSRLSKVFIINRNGKESYYNLNGQSVSKPNKDIDDSSFLFNNLYTFVNEDGKYGVIDGSKKTLIEPTYDMILKIEGINAIEAREEDGSATIYSENLEKVCTISEGIVENIKENFAIVYNQSERVYLNKTGKEVKNTEVFPNQKLFTISNDGKWGFCEKNGNIVIEPQYDMVTEINEFGFAGIRKDDKWGVIKEDGTIVVEPVYQIDSYYLPVFIGKYVFDQTDTVHCIDLSENL